ncbi:MAG: DUF6263 family protein [Phycisphaerales bacterium]
MTSPNRTSPTRLSALLLTGLLAFPVAAGAQSPGAGNPDFSTPATPKEKKPGAKDPRPADDSGMRGEKVDLRPRFEKGEEIRYTMTVRNDSRGTISGIPGMPAVPELPDLSRPEKDQPAKEDGQQMEQEIDFVLRVKEASAEKGATVEMVYERVRLKMTSGGSTLEFDSAKPPAKGKEDDGADLLGPIVKGLVGTTMTLEVDSSGNITKVTGGDNLAMPGLMQQAGLVPDAKTLGPLFGPVNSKKTGSGLVGVGEKWSNVDDLSLSPFGGLKMTTEHTLRSHKANEAEVYFNGRVEPQTESGRPASPLKLSQTGYRGKFLWDTRKGQLKGMESEMEVQMDGPGANGGTVYNKTFSKIERRTAPARKSP